MKGFLYVKYEALGVALSVPGISRYMFTTSLLNRVISRVFLLKEHCIYLPLCTFLASRR